jgi:hypothetical protein
MPPLPEIDYFSISTYFVLLMTYIGVLYGLNKAIIIMKS